MAVTHNVPVVFHTYDGTPESLPHFIKKGSNSLTADERKEIEAEYLFWPAGSRTMRPCTYNLVIRYDYSSIDDDGGFPFLLHIWETKFIDEYDDNDCFHLNIGDMWAEVPCR